MVRQKKVSKPLTTSQEMYNERRRAKRALERLQKAVTKQAGKVLQETRKQIRSLQKAVRDSYQDKKTKQYKLTIAQLESKTKSGKEYAKKTQQSLKRSSVAENKRRTKMLENYFRSAARTEEQRAYNLPSTPEQKLARKEQEYFYSALRPLWLGGKEEMRNENIVAALSNVRLQNGRYIQNLQDAFEYVKEQFGDKWVTLEDVKRGKYNTLDAEFANEEEYETGSPPSFSYEQLEAAGVRF